MLKQRIDMLEHANFKMTYELNTIELKMNQKMQQVQEKLMELAQPSQVFCPISETADASRCHSPIAFL